ncbi:hypothetical protein E8E78_11295 [Pseudomonas sp. BN505]|nr:hypothetical protein [Pseudomonas sp. BN605]MDH4857176.1 hypothetical protein [Pseudomonas sp. BN505]
MADSAVSFTWWYATGDQCGSGHAREEYNAVDGTGCAGVRGHARSHSYRGGLSEVAPARSR